ncbi:hypothetical protein BWR18_18575 [Tateyamaria omphalii]|uniref:HTH araC/xylS-type domain-containing protein n=2 Tax=Tateyamaria omphalii TaxID=299262 RepID=A0A1P8N1E0_9RHOB|nr:hypothetical protein BWR18_18575 [Tateyamaria omphalii]
MDDATTAVSLDTLARRIARYAMCDGVHQTDVPGLHLIRSAHPTQEIHTVHAPALCIVVQGAKRVVLADQVIQYDPAHHLLVSFDLPIVGQVIEAMPSRPYLCLRLDVSTDRLAQLATECLASTDKTVQRPASCPGLCLGETTAKVLGAADRLSRLVETPDDIAVLAPLYERELLYRVMRTQQGQLAVYNVLGLGRGAQVARAITWLRQNYRAPFEMKKLTEFSGLQHSALHQHFKDITRMTPLQYHKQLRLHEARRLMLFQNRTAAEAAFSVGYESPSQFSREYHRLFGQPPIRDVETLSRTFFSPDMP